jgi:hypothetical protein
VYNMSMITLLSQRFKGLVELCQSVEHLLFLTFIHTIQYNLTFIQPLPFAFAEALFLVVSSSFLRSAGEI